MKYFISDTHFGHENILKLDRRPFSSIEDHDRQIISLINDTLKAGDIIYHLGDLAWSQEAFDRFHRDFRDDVTLHLIRGNHDDRWQGRTRYMDIHETYLMRHENIWLSHYPHLSWPGSFKGSMHLFGHVHGNREGVGRSMDVSANVIGYTPISLDDVVAKLEKIEPHGV